MNQKGIIENPIIRGFNPDPSIIRVEDDYYIANSTFEWFPGVQIHHSNDLVNWQLICRPLDRVKQLDLRGVPDSCGVWAPCLSYHNGIFYLVYSNVKSFAGEWKDTPNYLVTATDIYGPWSDPVYLNSSGFDASLFHDDDSRSYLVNMLMDHRKKRLFGGIILQEYDLDKQQLVGEIHYLTEGTELGCTEGPHIYKRHGYYYLLLAEGGTGYEHSITLMRSRSITGPYEIHPDNPIITAKYNPENYLQKTAHGDVIETQDGSWYAVFLTGRPLSPRGRCTLGRESAIAPLRWSDDDWLYIDADSKAPQKEVMAPALSSGIKAVTDNSKRITFSARQPLDINLQALREPITSEWADVKEREGFLRLSGRDSLSSTFSQSLLAHRLQAHHAAVTTMLEFEPRNMQQMAGVVCYYNTGHYHYLHIRGDDMQANSARKYLDIASCDNFEMSEPLVQSIEVTGVKSIFLKVEFNYERVRFFYALEEDDWQSIGPALDGSILSDDYVAHTEMGFQPCFTGAFIGLCCQDLSGQRIIADFAYFDYHEHNDVT